MSSAVPRFLERWYDPGIDVPAGLGRERLIQEQIDRIVNTLAVITVTGSIPRRLGIDASDRELAIDKKRARRVAHVLRQSLPTWVKELPEIPTSDEIKREGAQLDWVTWIEEYVISVEASLRLIATWSIQNGDQHWGRSAATALENELRWMSYALRD